MSRLEGLSAEILPRIIERCPESDQISSRFVSKRLNDAISPRLFRDFTVYTDGSSAGHHPFPLAICPFITSLTLVVVDYEELDEAAWHDEVKDRWLGCRMSHNRVYHSRHHITQAWEVYERCRQDLQNNTIRLMTC